MLVCLCSYHVVVILYAFFFFLMIRRPPRSTRTDTLFPYTTLFRSTNLLAHAVEAARARATLGEISLAMEESFERYGTQPTPVKGVYAAPYEGDDRWQQVLDGVAAVERRLGRKPKLDRKGVV